MPNHESHRGELFFETQCISVAADLKLGGRQIILYFLLQMNSECNGERIVKICPHLPLTTILR